MFQFWIRIGDLFIRISEVLLINKETLAKFPNKASILGNDSSCVKN